MKKAAFITLFFMVIMALASAPAGATVVEASFSDVADSYWGASEIKVLYTKGWIFGYNDGTFRPENNLTRAEMAAMLVKATGKNMVLPGIPSYSDVDVYQWYYLPVETAGSFFSDPETLKGHFRPEDYITREEAVSAIIAATNRKEPVNQDLLSHAFLDHSDIAESFKEAVTQALALKITRGYPDRTFRPQKLLTRSEASVLVLKALYPGITINDLLNSGIVGIPSQKDNQYTSVVSFLSKQYGTLNSIEINFFIRDLPLAGEKDILVYARVDPYKYFTFSDTVYKPSPERVREYTEEISIALSRVYPNTRIITVLGFSNLILFDTAPEVFGSNYVRYSPREGAWKVERFYACTIARNSNITDTWLESV